MNCCRPGAVVVFAVMAIAGLFISLRESIAEGKAKMSQAKTGVPKTKQGNRRGNKLKIVSSKTSIYAGFKASFN
jgi:hypothetical protein